MSEFSDDRVEPATMQRRRLAREQGNVARSQDLASAAILIGTAAILLYFGGGISAHVTNVAKDYLGGEAWRTMDAGEFVQHWHALVRGLAVNLLPVLGLVLVLAVLSHLLQTGFLFRPQQIAMDLGRINPAKGFGRIFSLGNLVRLPFGLVKLGLIAAVAWLTIKGDLHAILNSAALDTPQLIALIARTLLMTILKVGGSLAALALFDYGFQWWKRERDMRMTVQEVREEQKNDAVDPQIAARRRTLRTSASHGRLASDVPQADVVVAMPGQLAVAIQYDAATMESPRIVAKGAGAQSERIRRLATAHGVPVVDRDTLAQSLYNAATDDDAVPAQQFAAVAELLAYIYELRGQQV